MTRQVVLQIGYLDQIHIAIIARYWNSSSHLGRPWATHSSCVPADCVKASRRPSGCTRAFDKPPIGSVTGTDGDHFEPSQARARGTQVRDRAPAPAYSPGSKPRLLRNTITLNFLPRCESPRQGGVSLLVQTLPTHSDVRVRFLCRRRLYSQGTPKQLVAATSSGRGGQATNSERRSYAQRNRCAGSDTSV